MEGNIPNPSEEGLSMFGMNFASKGLSWAENLYQRWENICQNNIIVQEPSKIVDAVGEQVRKIYEEVTDDWDNPFALGCDKVPASDSSLEQDVIADVCEESKTSHDEGSINEGSLISPMLALAISSEDPSTAPLSDLQQDERKETCDSFNMTISFTPPETNRCSCSSERGDDNEKVSNSSTSYSGSWPPADEVSLSEFPDNMVEGKFMLSHFTDPTEEDAGKSMVQEVAYFVQSFSTVPEQRGNLSEPETSLSIMDIGSSDCFSEHKAEYSVAVDKTVETNEEFEDVSLENCFEEKKLEDCWKDAESYELALISYRAMKNRSYKKKLRDAFTSRFYSLKKSNERGASFYGDIESDLAKIGIASSSFDSSKVSEASNLVTLESPESDWELL